MEIYIVSYSHYMGSEDGIYNEVVAFDNEADAENRFSDYVTNDLLDGFDGTAEEFDKERDRLLGCVTEERYMQSRVLNVEINEECYCVTLTRQMI